MHQERHRGREKLKSTMSKYEKTELHVVMFPWFAFGHISPFIQLSNKLSAHGLKISFLSAPGNISRIKSSLTLAAQIIPVPIPHIDGLPPGLDSTSELTPSMAELLKQALDLMQPQIKTLLSTLKPHFIFFDFAHHWLPPLASEIGIKTLFFSVFSAISGAYITVPTRLLEKKTGETEKTPYKSPILEDLKKPPAGFPSTSLTSLKPFEAREFLYVFTSFDGCSTVFDRALSCFKGCTAVVIKTCSEMESPYVEYIKTQFQKPVLMSGPLVPEPPSGVLDKKRAQWLDQFAAKSVIYCSFGSETFMSDDQIKELALGLELTGLPFFLVLNFPANLDAGAELNRALPDGFLERVKDKGIVHTGWVQQQLILAHTSVGCYVCHSGFSSVIEALVNDCQLVLLPQKGDQFLNSKLISGDMKVGVEVNRREDDGYFGKENIFEAVKKVMVEIDKEPGMSIRANQEKWREFLLDGEIQNKFIFDLIEEMKAMA
ncbi:hypothetical protein L1049_004111 [Liquidambar formosana]|uniref:Glycosyltransferase n=1 Tax=Liquidambar formosana TaxID=63359 RepID=A0AAP0WY31_LIQFO